MTDTSHYTAANKAAWDASAASHEPAMADLLAAASGPEFNTFDPTMTALLTDMDLQGKTAVQIGCNNARELLSLASFGAIPTLGIDQSSDFLAQGQRLIDVSPHAPKLLEADIYALPDNIGTFDIVLITIGVLNWMPDLPRFFAIVAGFLGPKGRLVIYETHPFLEVFDPASATPFEPAYDYFATDPDVSDEVITYDGQDHGQSATSYWFTHRFSDVVIGVTRAGLALDDLKEYPHSNREVDYDIYATRSARLPMCFSLIASKP